MTVTLQSAHTALTAALHRLRDTTRELELIAVSDQPRGGGVVLVDEVGNAALEISGASERAATALQGRDATAVALCQSYVHFLGSVLTAQLAAPERLADLGTFGGERGREATAWADEVVTCVQACQRSLWNDVLPATLGYWQEIAAQTSPCSTSGVGR
ncbi:hypothetical protein ACQEWB_09730 [Streptomyces sp. CA-249302]|uniref:hypothetical protein n=1 Tax=Streptomyces sp. CA-249302 TaxID=3240058 RepID=UPI003D950A02